MRKILFRGKKEILTEENKRYTDGWIYGDTLYKDDDGVYLIPCGVSAESYHLGTYNFRANSDRFEIMVAKIKPETLEQYTGLKDKNGRMIFEGDIVKFLGMVGKVVCECGAFGIGFDQCINYKKLDNFTLKRIGYSFCGVCCDNFISLYEIYWNLNNVDEWLHEVEVIGNIYDNPELI